MSTERFNVVVAGSRTATDYELLRKYCDVFFSQKTPTAIISGCARGADELGERYAQEHHLDLKRFPAQWDKYGKMAGMMRNREMLEVADALVAVWDGKSRGTENMIRISKKKRSRFG